MPNVRFVFTVILGAAVLSACLSYAPGAASARVTKDESSLAACTALGKIEVPGVAEGQVNGSNAGVEFRNQIVAVGGNAALVTDAPYGVPIGGIAYRCP